ncbi:hypothetical protein PIB30_044456 [Stylosanthes scabra]|uniref:Uncharacterized protein n=1 Tax=Stylosanthes scabra TaxID=79078 RepID=A0ABU6TGM1_9FABA|nr:hypothetical protein [Stylosanthes scabra]
MAPAREGRRAAVGVVNERRREAELRGCNAKGKGGTASPCSHASPSLSRRRSVAATAGSQVLVVVCRREGMNEEREGFEGRGDRGGEWFCRGLPPLPPSFTEKASSPPWVVRRRRQREKARW